MTDYEKIEGYKDVKLCLSSSEKTIQYVEKLWEIVTKGTSSYNFTNTITIFILGFYEVIKEISSL